jgi:hypothetical protein
MSTRLPLLALAALLPALLPHLAQAGAAGGNFLGCAATQQVRFVVDANANGLRDPAENSTCTSPFVDDTNPDEPVVHQGSLGGPVCVPASLAQLRGSLALIADDTARDNDNVNTGEVLTLLLELAHQSQTFRIAESYSAAALGNLVIGNWDNRLDNEYNVFGVKFKGALFLTPAGVAPGALDDLGARLAQLADDLNLVPSASDVIPVIAGATRDAQRKRFVQSSPSGCADPDNGVAAGCGELEVDESGGSPLASVAVYRLTISFAEKVTGTPPTCQ